MRSRLPEKGSSDMMLRSGVAKYLANLPVLERDIKLFLIGRARALPNLQALR